MASDMDPEDWTELRALGHRIMDDMFDGLAGIRDRPVWQRMPENLRQELQSPLPHAPESPAATYDAVQRLVVPYVTGNLHPRFMGWVHGGGNPVGMLAELIAGGLNANLGGRDHAPIEIERQVVHWAAEMVGMPAETSGLLVTGTSMANMIAVLVARRDAAGPVVRGAGVGTRRLVAYAARTAHGCIAGAMDMAGLGTDALRLIGCDRDHRIDLAQLSAAVQRDRDAGMEPFLVVGTAGTVDVGAIDDLAGLAALCREEALWFHVDGAFGALAMLSPRYRPLLAGIEHADSLAFDFHKWAQVPYDAGCILVRDGAKHFDTFAQTAAYLRREERGLAGGHPWPGDFGPDLSRGFRALKVWMTLRAYGADRLGDVVEASCAVAQHLAARVRAEPALELLAPVALNIVCFRVRTATDPDGLNREIVADLQEAGIAAPSTTTVDGKLAIRAAIVNHRTRADDVDAMVDAVLERARASRRLLRQDRQDDM
jgi:glutamate/tyrosine decarboxylase-like PLP-dependent enzyme